MGSDNKIVYLENARRAYRAAGRDYYDRLRQLGFKRLLAMLRHMLDQADDALFDLSGRVEAGAAHGGYFDAMRQLRLKRRELEERFQQEIMARFRALVARPADARRVGTIEPEPAGDPELAVAVESMVDKARTRAGHHCQRLQARLGVLFPTVTVTELNNPFDPLQICTSFRDAAAILELDINARLVLFKLFDRYVMGQLSGLYEEANGLLAELGVPGGHGEATGCSSASAEQGPQLAEMLRDLLAAQKYRGGARQRWTGTGYAPAASIDEVVAALSILQQAAGEAAAASDGDIKGLLDHALRQRSGARQMLARDQDDIVDIVGLLFEAILDDPNLSHSIKALIARLQIPLLKLALLDRGFFGNRKHPARLLINELAEAALGWSEPVNVERDPLYRMIDYVVGRILNEFSDDAALFEQLLQEFRQFREEERARTRLIEERTRQTAEGKAKVDAARALVDAELAGRIGGRQLSDAVRTLLLDGWAKVLFISCLKDGSHSEVFRSQLAVVDRLLWSLEPKSGASERKDLLMEIPGLLHDLRTGLNSILFNPFEMTRLFNALEAEHIRALSGRAGVARDAARPTRAACNVDGQSPVLPAPSQLSETLARVQALPEGTWFEFRDERGVMRAKLSARLAEGNRLIFVNRAGFKLADKRAEQVASELDAGVASILDANQLFDKALESVVNTLRERRPQLD